VIYLLLAPNKLVLEKHFIPLKFLLQQFCYIYLHLMINFTYQKAVEFRVNNFG